MFKKNFVYFFLSCVSFHALSQDYIEKSYWNNRLEWQSRKLLPSIDQGYFILAYSGNFGEYSTEHDELLKLDSSGNEMWHFEIESGEGGIGYARSDFSVSPDSFVYFACNELGCIWNGSVYKLDASGNIVWDRLSGLNISFPGSKFYAICSANNNDQIVGGAITSTLSCTPLYPYFCRIAPDGSTVWEYTLDSLFPGESINKIEPFRNNTFLLHMNSITVQIDSSGNILSSIFPSGAYIFGNETGYLAFGEHQISRLSDSLNIIWQSPIYNDRKFYNLTIDSLGYIFATGKLDTCNGEMFVSKFDTTGNILFTKSYGGGLVDEGYSIILTSDHHIAAAGTHHVQKWNVFEHHRYDCWKYVTYTSLVHFVKLKTEPLTFNQCQASSGSYLFCNSDSILLSAPPGFSYLWNNGNVSQDILIDTTGEFQVTITDSLGNSEVLPIFNSYGYPIPQLPHFPDMISTQCTGNFNVCLEMPFSDSIFDRSFQWYRSGWPSTSFVSEYSFNGLPAATYYNVSSNFCGTDTSGKYIFLNVPPIVSLGSDTTVCNPNTILLDAGGGSFNYLWQDGSNNQTFLASNTTTDSVEYSVVKTDFVGCSTTDSILIVFEVCAGITNQSDKTNLTILPNPNTGIFRIDFNELYPFDEIIITNTFGNEISRTKYNGNSHLEIELNAQTGLYFVRIVQGNRIGIYKIVKM